MFPEDFNYRTYNYPYNSNAFGSWFFLFIIVILAAIWLTLGNEPIKAGNDKTETSCNSDGTVEYWYSDTPEQYINSSSVTNNCPFIRKAQISDNRQINSNRIDNFHVIKGILFWI